MKNFKYYKTLISLLGVSTLALASCSKTSENNLKNIKVCEENTNDNNIKLTISKVSDNKYEEDIYDDNLYEIETELMFNSDSEFDISIKEYEADNFITFVNLIEEKYNAQVTEISLLGNIDLDFLENVSYSDSLESLYIYNNNFGDVKNLTRLQKLKILSLHECNTIKNLNELKQLDKLENIFIDNCENISYIDELSDININISNSGFVKVKNQL